MSNQRLTRSSSCGNRAYCGCLVGYFIQTCACLEQERHQNSVVVGDGDTELAVDARGEHGSLQRAYLP